MLKKINKLIWFGLSAFFLSLFALPYISIGKNQEHKTIAFSPPAAYADVPYVGSDNEQGDDCDGGDDDCDGDDDDA
jgi:hypothetical protein